MADSKQVGPGLYVKLGLDYNGMIGGIAGVSLALNQTLDLFGKFERGAQQLVDLANKAMDFQSEIDKLSTTLDMSTAELYKWSNVARYADSDISSLSSILRKLSINITDTGEAGDKARAMLNAMHVSIQRNADGSVNLSETFPDIIEGLKGINDAGQKNTVAMTLFGRSFQELSGYMLMSKSEMKGYFDEGWSPTPEQEQKLRDYEQATKDLNTATSNLAKQGGAELSSSMQDWAELLNDAVDEGAPLLEFLGYVNDALSITVQLLDDVVTGYLSWDAALHGDFGKIVELGQGLNERTAARRERQETRDMLESIPDSARGKSIFDTIITEEGKIKFQMPDTGKTAKDPNAMTSFEILRTQTEMDTLNKVTIPDQNAKLKELKKQYGDMGDKGTEAAKALNRDIIELTNNIALNINKVAEMTDKLGKAGAAVAASGGLTYNQQFKSSLQDGGVGPDWAGFSELANKSQSELEIIAKGGLGKSTGEAEKAQQYLNRMKAGGGASTAASTAIKASSPADQAKLDTKTLDTELSKQGDLFTTLKDTIIGSWTEIEKAAVIHWTALSELARGTMQKEMDDQRTTAKYVTETVGYSQVISVKDGVMAAQPIAFSAPAAPVLKAIDFSGVQLLAAAKTNDSDKGSGKDTSKTGSVVIQITNKDGVTSEVTQNRSEAMAANISLKSGG